jgi:imidazolonepropionase-like amidohydrolase
VRVRVAEEVPAEGSEVSPDSTGASAAFQDSTEASADFRVSTEADGVNRRRLRRVAEASRLAGVNVRLLFLVALALAHCAPAAAPPVVAAKVTAFVGVTVVPCDRNRLLEDQTVVTDGARIVAVGPSAKVEVPPGATRVDGRGKYLMPGIAEMHGHLPDGNFPEENTQLTLFVANGVTTVRGVLGAPNHLVLRDRIERGELLGPRLFVYGPALNGQSTPTPEAGVAQVRAYKSAGYDGLKVHEGLSRATFDAIAIAAKQAGLPFGGHVPNDVGVERALEAGQKSIEHLDGYVEALERDPMKDPKATPVGLDSSVVLDRVDESKIPALVAATRRAGAMVVPTMVVWRTLFGDAKVASLRELPELAYVPAVDVEAWVREKTEDEANAPPEGDLRRLMALRDRLLGAFADAGLVLLGSDAPQSFSVPGFSLRHEMQAMVRAGMTPWQVVEAGTVAPARFLGRANEFGTVEVGKRADLILVDGNPLDDVANVFRSSGVMLAGRWLPKSALDALLADVAKSARAGLPDLPVTEENARRLVGAYEVPKMPIKMDVEKDGAHLVLVGHDPHGTKRVRLVAQSDGSFRAPEIRARIVFEIRDGRAAAFVLSQHGAEIKAERAR